MDHAQAISSLPEASVARLPCRAHAPGFGEDRVNAPNEGRAQPALMTPEGQPPEAFQFDREFHAMLARLTGGISPVALSLAFIDWTSHLAAAPRQQMEIAQDALRSVNKFYQSALHCLSPGQEPWSLIRPQPQDRRFARQIGNARRSICSRRHFC